ncbi:hypothetical protein SAMN02799622_00840 [Methylobacterium sp. UNC378MF]|uniref:hypothetical protein n=1 Tax=Methylobacterium sp. UNC378MF TaxID=1502748 RepID=UPI00088D47B9|nr:hypothetical protein [Methylobacterium sp. UNC378MF]SDA12884.1 hypothetical protein SAMN02799622_00840 [Methylobacterium sp. UNC378MF]
MADDKLRIVATVEDQFTGPLSKLEKGIKRVGDETTKQGATWKKDWAGVREEVGKFQGVLRGFDPIFAAVGVTGFGAAMSITGMVSALRGFSGSTQQLSMLSRETGVAVDKLRAFGALGERFGVSADSMKSSVASFATSMFDLRRRWGEAYSGLQAMNLGKLAEDLVNAPNMDEALKRAVDGIQAIPEPEVRRRVSRMLFGADDIARIAGSMTGKFSEALAQVQKEVGHLDKQTEEAAARFEQSMGRIGAAAERLKLKVLGPMLKGTADLIEDAEKNGLRGNEGEQALRNQLSPFGGPEATPRDKLEGRRAQVEQQLKLLEAGPRGADYQRKHDRMIEELKRVADELQKVRESGGASVSPSSFGGSTSGGGSLIQKAAWGGFGSSAGASSAIPTYGSSGGIGAGGGSGGGSGGGTRAPAAPDLGDGIRGRPFGSKGPVGSSSGPLGSEAPIGDRGMLDLIARAEGTTRRGYNDSFAHQVGGDLTGKTLGEIEQIQRGMRGSSAIGRYQFMRGTLFGSGRRGDRGLLGELGLGRDDKFTPELQDRLANALIERRYKEAKRAQARQGGDFMRHFRTALAREWASFPGDYGQRGRNGGMYPGQSASIGRDRLTEGAQRWLDEREGRVATSRSESGRRSEVLADPNDERRKPDEGGIRQVTPWKKAPALAPTKASMEGGSEDFPSFLKRRAEGGATFGQREDEAIEDQRRRTVGGMNDDLDRARQEAPDGDTETTGSRHYADIQGRSNDPAYKPTRDLTLDEIRKFRRPDRKVGDALMDRFYGRGGPGGGPGMQMPGAPVDPRGTLHIKFDSAPAGMTHRADMGGLFRETTVSKGRPQMDMDRA